MLWWQRMVYGQIAGTGGCFLAMLLVGGAIYHSRLSSSHCFENIVEWLSSHFMWGLRKASLPQSIECAIWGLAIRVTRAIQLLSQYFMLNQGGIMPLSERDTVESLRTKTNDSIFQSCVWNMCTLANNWMTVGKTSIQVMEQICL